MAVEQFTATAPVYADRWQTPWSRHVRVSVRDGRQSRFVARCPGTGAWCSRGRELPPVFRTLALRSPLIIRKDVPHARTSPARVPTPRGRARAPRRQTTRPARQRPRRQPIVPAELAATGRRRRQPRCRRPADQRREEGARRTAPPQQAAGDGKRHSQARGRLFCQRERPPKVIYSLVRELADDAIPVAVACRVLKVST